MKKTLVSALTTALVVGAASTTFAAANPFSDVPADHWAYDAVSQLAADGVIEGYGDTTFKGDKNITRYEMAQMIAKAMAKTNVGSSDKALIDKLAAEFSDELNNLGVRVANLEKNADKVKFTGMVRYDYWSTRNDAKNTARPDQKIDHVLFRLYPDAEINDHWHVQARLQGTWTPAKDTASEMKLSYVHAEGNYSNFNVKLGKMPLYSTSDDGLIMDGMFSGAQMTFGNKLKAIVSAGRQDLSADGYDLTGYNVTNAEKKVKDRSADYQSLQLVETTGKLTAGAGYHHFQSREFAFFNGYDKTQKEDKADIWTVGGSYAFDKNVALAGYYGENTDADAFEKAGSVQLSYKGASAANKGSWGAFAAYRHLGQNVSFSPTYDDMWEGMKGYSFGASYAPLKHVIASASYTMGKDLATDTDSNILFGRLKLVW
ncbi:S-layer homology domain-containing protein [Selenomonas montiformis]|uniref:S-layer homology domain-containing protein n=1 Tax=Selenomonas montiformis TaxID=2652285 RepID=UPI003F89A650